MTSKSVQTRSSRIHSRSRLSAAIAAVCIAAPAVHAQPADPVTRADEMTSIAVAFGAGTSDNVLRRADGDQQSGTYSTIGATMDIARSRPRLNATANGDIEFRSYTADGLDSERIGIIEGSVEALVVPERFTWFLSGRGGQGRTDPFGIETPENRENIDIFETGPRITLPIGERTSIQLTGTAGTRLFEESTELESDTSSAEAGIYRTLSPTTQFGLVVSSRSTEYENSQFDNDVERVYLSYTRRLATGSASFSIGSNTAEFINESETSPWISANWQRNLGTRSSFSLDLTNELVDATDNVDYDSLAIYAGGPGGATQSLLLTQDIYEATDIGLSFAVDGTRTSVRVGALFGESEYMSRTTLDNDRFRLTFTGERNMSTRMNLGFEVDYTNRDFTNRPQEDKDTFSRIWVERDFAGPFSGQLSFGHNSRSGTDTARFDENIWTLSLLYDLRSTGADPLQRRLQQR